MKLYSSLILIACSVLLCSCGGQQETSQPTAASPAPAATQAPVVEEKPQTKEERIQEIRLWYSKAKKSANLNCKSVKVPKNGNAVKSLCRRCVIDDSIIVVSFTDIFGDGAVGQNYYFFNRKLFCYEEESESSGYAETTALFYNVNGDVIYGSESLQDDWEDKSFKDREIEKIEGYTKSHLGLLELANNILSN